MPPSSLLRLSRNLHVPRLQPHGFGIVRSHLQTRPLSAATSLFTEDKSQDPERHPNQKRDDQLDRTKIDRESDEYALSGTDDTSAANEEAAFDPNITDPQEAKKKAGEGNKVNPLDASPANPDISEGTAEETGGVKPKESESSARN